MPTDRRKRHLEKTAPRTRGVEVDIDQFSDMIEQAEHGDFLQDPEYNPYTSTNSDGAMGRYQFLQGVWQDEIFRFAEEKGYKYQGPQDFVSNSALQDDFFEFYVQEHLVPFANQIKKKYDVSFMTDEEILASLHFIGPTKFKHTLVNNTQDQPQSYSTSLNDYLSRIPQKYFADGGQATSWLNDSLALTGKPVMPTSNQPQGQTYQVKAGDNLSKIAQEYGTDLKTLTELNPDIDPSSYTIYVDQQLNLPPVVTQGISQAMGNQSPASTQPSGKKYVIKAGDNLSKISKELGVPMDDLVAQNNINDPNTIMVGQEIFYGDADSSPGFFDRLKQDALDETKGPESYLPWPQVRATNNTFNHLSNLDAIVAYQSDHDQGNKYVVVDKQAGLVHLYDGQSPEPFLSAPVDVGANQGDAITATQYNDLDGNNQITQNEIFSGNVNWSMGSKTTGAGAYNVSNIDADGYGGLPILNLRPAMGGGNVATSFHKGFVDDGVSRVSNGCVRCRPSTLNALVENTKMETPVYILPEETGNQFTYDGTNLQFKIGDNNLEKRWVLPSQLDNDLKNLTEEQEQSLRLVDQEQYALLQEQARKQGQEPGTTPGFNQLPTQYEFYTDKQGRIQKGRGLNQLESNRVSMPIKAEVDVDALRGTGVIKVKGFAGGAPPPDAPPQPPQTPHQVKVAKSFAQTLQDFKPELSQKLNLSNEAYNEIAQIAFGILGTESSYGVKNNAATNLTRFTTKATKTGLSKLEKKLGIPPLGSKLLPSTGGDVYSEESLRENIPFVPEGSEGLTQFNFNSMAPEGSSEREFLEELGLTPELDYTKPENAAKITTAILAKIAKNNGFDLSGGLYSEDAQKLISRYHDGETYYKNVLKFSEPLKLYQKVDPKSDFTTEALSKAQQALLPKDPAFLQQPLP